MYRKRAQNNISHYLINRYRQLVTYSQICPGCRCRSHSLQRFCKYCRILLYVHKIRCPACADTLHNNICISCTISHRGSWQAAYTMGSYKNELKSVITTIKSQSEPTLAAALGELAQQAWCAQGIPPPDIIAYVPSTKSSMQQRGYNPVQQITAGFSHLWKQKIRHNLLHCQHNKTVKSLSRHHRLDAKLHFSAATKTSGIILLIDDVHTTGTTLKAAAKAIQKKHQGAIYVATLARTEITDN